MALSKSPSRPALAKTSYRKELARLKQFKPFCKALVHECVKSLLPREAVYHVAVRYWSSLNQKDLSYLAKALGPDEDFSYINEHLTLATERTESGRIDFHFEELVAAGVLKPLSPYTNSNDSASSNDSAIPNDSASSDAVVKEAPGEIHPIPYFHSFAHFPPEPFYLPTHFPPPSSISWDAASSPPPSHPDLPEAKSDKASASANFFGQEKQGVVWTPKSRISAESSSKTETVVPRRSSFSTGFQPSGTSPANQPPSTPSSEKPAKSSTFGNSFYL
ncbi:unnamed protein product [Clonostachys rhizophaga]|uniref:Uncharacterized protein n=1 Tax=Clonostachys rhizophaga TaxID=160324 RepID=A0A9N9VXB3_9HYPO|nr:unnamed protein product [Clonostachys rhizophaga]